jgi:hypothetical protein
MIIKLKNKSRNLAYVHVTLWAYDFDFKSLHGIHEMLAVISPLLGIAIRGKRPEFFEDFGYTYISLVTTRLM